MNKLLAIEDAFVDFDMYLDTILKDVEDEDEEKEEEKEFTRGDYAEMYGVPAWGSEF